MYWSNALAVIPAPSYRTPSIITPPSPPYINAPEKLKIIITNAVIVQITTVSIKGSNKATKPSEAAYFVFTAECAIEADPAPASFENAALWKPIIKTLIIPPTPIAVGLNASVIINLKASSIKLKLDPIMYKQAIM